MRSRLLIQRGPGEKTYEIRVGLDFRLVTVFTTVGVNGNDPDGTALRNLSDWSEHNAGTFTLWRDGFDRPLAECAGGLCRDLTMPPTDADAQADGFVDAAEVAEIRAENE